MTIENILRKHITRETHKGSHARIVVNLAVDIRDEIYRELEEGMEEKPKKPQHPIENGYHCFSECGDCMCNYGFNEARSRALKIVKGESV